MPLRPNAEGRVPVNLLWEMFMARRAGKKSGGLEEEFVKPVGVTMEPLGNGPLHGRRKAHKQ